MEKLKSSKSMEKIMVMVGGSTDAAPDEVSRPKTPSFMEKLKSAKSKESIVDAEATTDSTLIGRIRGRSMERKADIYAKIKETRDIVQNTEKALVESFENTEKVLAEKFDQIRSKSQETKKRIMWNDTEVEAISAARSEIIKTEVNKCGMYKVSSLERDKSKSKERKTSKSSSSEKANKDPKKVQKSGSSEINTLEQTETKTIKSSMISKYTKAFSAMEEKASDIRNVATKFNFSPEPSEEIKDTVVISNSNGKITTKNSEMAETKTVKSSMISKYTNAFSAMEERSSETKVVANNFTESKSNPEPIEEKKQNIEELYSKVNKKTNRKDLQEKKTVEPSQVPDLLQVTQNSKPVKSFIKPGEDQNKIDLTDLKGYKLEKCDLKAKDPTKILPTRVANCTPRPFTPFSGGSALSHSPAFSTPSSSPMPPITASPLPKVIPANIPPTAFSMNPVSPSPIAFTTTPNTNVQKPTPQLSPKVKEAKVKEIQPEHTAMPGSAFSKFVDSIQFPTVFDKQSAPEEEENTFVATVNTSSFTNLEKAAKLEDKKMSSKAEKFAKYIQKKTEKETKTTNKPLTMNELTTILSGEQSIEEEHTYSTINQTTTYEPVNILTADLPDVANVKEKGEPEKVEANAIMTKFKEFKTKTKLEVSKLTRSRSVQKKETVTERRESAQSEDKLARTRSESRTHKAGKMMKDFTSNILKRR